MFTQSVSALAYSDNTILSDTINNTYIGRIEAKDIINNSDFKDISEGHYAKESIVRMSALNLVKGYGNNYNPDNAVSNQEVLAFLLRAIGLENEAQSAGIQQKANYQDSSVRDLWSLGYLRIALNRGLITNAQYTDATSADQDQLDPQTNFIRAGAATREMVAEWIAKVLDSVDSSVLNYNTTQQSVYQYSDWETISPERVSYVEKVSMAGIMKGSEGKFNPKAYVTRAEMAVILKNMDAVYYKIMGIEKKTGTVGAVMDIDAQTTANSDFNKKIYVRTSDGGIDVFEYTASVNSSPQPQEKDAVVYADGKIGGLSILKENDQIEYLVSSDNSTILYVFKTSEMAKEVIQDKLVKIDVSANIISLKKTDAEVTSYTLASGLIKDGIYIKMDNRDRLIKDIPAGSILELTLKNDIVIEIKYIGEQEMYTEIKGVVTENNSLLGYITIINSDGKEVTKNYYAGTVQVEKQQYYDEMDEVGYIDSIFPNFEYDDRDTYIEDVEAGDIVFIRVDENNPQYITEISAVTNYIVKYGKVGQISSGNGENISVLMEYENGQTEWLDIPLDVFISKNTYPAQITDIMAGDWIKVLVNEAILTPGEIIQSVKEVTIEGSARYITGIYKAQLINVNKAQKQMVFKDSQSLDKYGWTDYQQVRYINLNNSSGVEYYYNGNQVSLDYVSQRLKNVEAYIATETSFGGEKAVKISFRSSRDEYLEADNIIYANGTGTIGTVENSTINTDDGTIVVRYGRLTKGSNVAVLDYAAIELNGNSSAAVVSVSEAPNTSGVIIARGRIKSIDEGKSFQVQSMAVLNDMKWSYTPIERIFNINYNTQFYNENGWAEPGTFIDYTENTAYDKVYTIIADGTNAAYVIENPYVRQGIRGTIYEVDGNTVKLKDTYIYNTEKNTWEFYSKENSALTVTIPNNYIIVGDNQVLGINALKSGQQIKVMTDVLDVENLTQETEITGYITYIEK